MNFLPGKPIEDLVFKQIQTRQNAFKDSEGEGRQSYIALQQAVPWVRLSSAVKISPGTDLSELYGSGFKLARENVLYNFLDKGLENLPGYEFSEQGLGFRPKPGIIDVQIHSHNRFGSLRTAVVRFQCWSKEQIDKLELLYMRPGYTLLLEWGWSGYIDTKSKLFNNQINFLNLHDESKGILNAGSLREKLDKNITDYDYNYDGIFGLIKNFSWSARPDGGYDCTTSIVTTGELIESYKANFYLSQAAVNEKILNEIKQFNEEQVESKSQTFDGLELDFYSSKDDHLFGINGTGRATLSTVINEMKVKAGEIQQAIDDICFQAAPAGTLKKENYEVVDTDTVVVEYDVKEAALTELENTNKVIKTSTKTVKLKAPVAFVKIRSNPIEFALKYIGDGNVEKATSIVQNLINNSNGTLALKSSPPTRANTTLNELRPDTYQIPELALPVKKSPNLQIGDVTSREIPKLSLHRFFILQYIPKTEAPVTTTQDIEANEPEANPAPEGNTSLLHDLLINDVKAKLTKKHSLEFSKVIQSDTFAEVFKYRETELIKNTLLKKLVDDNNRYSTFLSGMLDSGKNSKNSEEVTDLLVYIKLGMLLDIFNEGALETDSKVKLFSFQTKALADGKTPTYFVHEDQISIDPTICILPSSLTGFGVSPEPITPVTLTQGQVCAILDIELECEYLANTLDGFIAQGGRVSTYDFLDQIFQDIKRVTGGVIELDLQFSEVTSAYAVVDRRKIARPGRDFPTISTLGKDSTITNLNLVSKLTPKITSMIGISAQDSPFTGTEEAAGFQALNKGLIDGVYPQRKDPLAFKENKDEEFKTFLDQFREDATNTLLYIESFYSRRNALPGADVACGNYENYCKILLGRKFKQEGTAFNFIIPFELTLSMRGLGGLHVMESFKINKNILPSTYGGRVTESKKAEDGTVIRGENITDVAFMITGLEHQINRQGWTTDIKTQIYNVDEDIFEKPITLEKGIVGIAAGKSKGTTPSNTPWSAAFISYIHSKAGYTKTTFPFSAAHANYAQQIRTSFLDNFTVLDPASNTPLVGDIIVKNREDSKLTFKTQVWSGYSHGDVVVQVPANATSAPSDLRATASIEVIGGNVADTVSLKKVTLIQNRIPVAGAFNFIFTLTKTSGSNGSGDYFVILRPKNKTLAQAVVTQAKAEHKFWQIENKFKESDAGAFDTLAEYWKLLGITLKKD